MHRCFVTLKEENSTQGIFHTELTGNLFFRGAPGRVGYHTPSGAYGFCLRQVSKKCGQEGEVNKPPGGFRCASLLLLRSRLPAGVASSAPSATPLHAPPPPAVFSDCWADWTLPFPPEHVLDSLASELLNSLFLKFCSPALKFHSWWDFWPDLFGFPEGLMA